ncbi:hypothetical protein X975_07141, partial [Stegodyphus mimosarum]
MRGVQALPFIGRRVEEKLFAAIRWESIITLYGHTFNLRASFVRHSTLEHSCS